MARKLISVAVTPAAHAHLRSLADEAGVSMYFAADAIIKSATIETLTSPEQKAKLYAIEEAALKKKWGMT